VTAIWPHRDDLITNPVAAGFFALSGTGEMTARSEIEELGRINTPIVLTNTMSVGLAYDATCRYLARHDPELGNQHGVLIPVVAECDDEYLNDVRGFHVTHEHVYKALDAARPGPVAEGCVGSGTGMICFGFKGGIGTSSRVLPPDLGGWTVGVLTMTNFGRRSRLTFAGIEAGHEAWGTRHEKRDRPSSQASSHKGDRVDGSCIVIVATDAPLDGRQLARLAKRAALGLGRTGSAGENGSGELLMAFSTTYRPQQGSGTNNQTVIEGESVNDLFAAVVDATEEAVLNSLCMATTTTGRYGRVVEALPLDRVRALLAQAGRIKATS
jgi:D-aminopeptidase